MIENKNIYLEEKELEEYIEDMFNDFSIKPVYVDSAMYHHNSSYNYSSSIINNGILTLNELNKRGIRKASKEHLELMSDINSHVNGIDGVSLSVTGLTDLYRNEEEYDPLNMFYVDFLVSDEVRACRMSINYGNEFVCFSSIEPEMIKSVDIRLLKYLKCIFKKGSYYYKDQYLTDLVNDYNCLKQISLALKQKHLDIPLRDMSQEDLVMLDIDKIIKTPSIVLKK